MDAGPYNPLVASIVQIAQQDNMHYHILRVLRVQNEQSSEEKGFILRDTKKEA